MEKKNTKRSILTGTIIAGALLTFSVNADARPTTQVLGTGAEVRAEIIDLNISSSTDMLFELKCGEAKETSKKGEAKPTEKSKKEGKATEAKCGEGKCGEGKCGGDDKKAETKKLDTKAEAAPKADAKKEGKATEAKCGEGKCGAE